MIAGSVNSVCSVSNVKVVFQRKREEGIKLMKYFVDTFKLFCWYSLPVLRIARSDFCVTQMTLMRLLTPYKPHIMLIALWSGSRFFTFWLKWFWFCVYIAWRVILFASEKSTLALVRFIEETCKWNFSSCIQRLWWTFLYFYRAVSHILSQTKERKW